MAVAQPGTEIRIASGLYTENVEITTPGLRLVPKDKDADIIWVSYCSPPLVVNIPNDGKVFLTNFKFAHRAVNEPVNEEKEHQEQTQMVLTALGNDAHERGTMDDNDPTLSYGYCLSVFEKMNTLIYVKKGRLEISVGCDN